MAKERIQKILAAQGVCSRRAGEKMIQDGRVTVNGRPVSLGDKADIKYDLIAVDGEKVAVTRKRELYYIALNKPRGYVTTMSDELGRKSVDELVEELGTRVYPVGRLDKNSEGLLLMTNDGDFANKMMHPRFHIPKTYRVTVRPDISDQQLVQLSEGVVIDGQKTQQASVHVLDKQPGRIVLEMTIREGRNRQIRKMCEAVGLECARLKRIAQGPVKLGMLKSGQWRHLKKEEVEALKNAVAKELKRGRTNEGNR